MNIADMKEIITFERTDGNDEWEPFLTTHAYINGVSGNEFFIANAGNEGSLTVTVTCRFQLKLMRVTPMQYRIKHGDIYYEIISPGDDVQLKHRHIKFRARRIYTEKDGEIV